ncbi:hypothetical protein [Salegentibacter sp. Hel_I_6]|uniref:hypothetical protein n=1 Tax=Salegentibacter sp. Hel_I_6 TaxID=1250278 RepID=UPI0005660A5C|nr:hypothetical protein [Salegentibacter sp. Hel_I_6]
MKKSILILSIIVLTACSEHNVAVVGEKRMQVSGNILDKENAPIENISVTASGSENAFLELKPNEILGEGYTNNAGEFAFVSLDSNNSFYGVSVNHPNNQDYREEYGTLHFLDSIGTRGTSYEFENLSLPEIQEFQVRLKNTSTRNDTLFYRFSYSNTEIYQSLIDNSFGQNFLRFHNEMEYWNRLLPGQDEMTISTRTLANSSIAFKYKFSSEATYDTINAEITPENPVYEFNF